MEATLGLRSIHLAHLDIETSIIALTVFAIIAILVAHVTKSVNFPGFGLSPYLRFAYNSFLKPHDAKTSDGQQSALESFYAAQVRHYSSYFITSQLRITRPAYMIPPESVFSVDVKTC